MVGDDIRTLTSKNTKWYQKAGAAISIASNFIPGGGVASKAAKAAIKGTSKSVKASKASKTVTKATKKVKTTSKKIKVNKKPKTVAASSIKRTTKTNSPTPLKVSKTTPKSKAKASPPPKKTRGETKTRVEKNEIKKTVRHSGKPDTNSNNERDLLRLDLQFFASKGKGKVARNIFGNDASKTIKGSDLRKYGESRGWTKTKTPNGPEKWVDKNGVARITIKGGSNRTPGSAGPRVEIKISSGQRIDPFGNAVTRKSEGNHTPIIFD